MAKWSRKSVGAVFKGLKNDDGTTSPNTLIFNEHAEGIVLKKGDKLQLESKSYKEQNVGEMVKKGFMNEEVAEKARFVISKMSDKVLADVVLLKKNEA